MECHKCSKQRLVSISYAKKYKATLQLHNSHHILCPTVPSTGLYFTLNGVVYLPSDTVLITDIGIGIGVWVNPDPGSSLVCNTSNVNTHCCRGRNNPNGGSLGEWYFPNGTIVPRFGDSMMSDFTRTGWTHQVRLNRKNNAMTPLGTYTCVVPDMNNMMNHNATITLGECDSIPEYVMCLKGNSSH